MEVGSISGRIGGSVFAIVVAFLFTAQALAAPPSGFTTPRVIGFTQGDDWEPWVEADDFGNVYVAWAHFGSVPGCDTCSSPVALIQVSHDAGGTFGPPRALNPVPVSYQIDLQVETNDAGTVWVAYLQDKDTIVQRSDDFGETWSAAVPANVDIKESWTDKVGLAVKGQDVYVSFSIAQRYYVSHSHDGGSTFTAVQLNTRSKDTAWTLTSGGAIDSKGNVYFSWVGIHSSGGGKLEPQEVFLTKSTDGGHSWSFITLHEDLPSGPSCLEFSCAWDFWGPQMVVGVDAADNVYVAYNAGVVSNGPPFIWFQSSTDAGATWSARKVVHSDGLSSAFHLFPAIVGGSPNNVHISWMDNREGNFNVYYRTSSDGGDTFGKEAKVNKNLGFRYQKANGFEFTYGDYYGLDLGPRGVVHLAWGESPDYIGPGNVFYSHN